MVRCTVHGAFTVQAHVSKQAPQLNAGSNGLTTMLNFAAQLTDEDATNKRLHSHSVLQ